MFQDKFVFAQLVAFLDRSKFNRIVAKYNGDPLCQTLDLLESIHCNDVRTTLQSRKPA